jgi:glucarate dehydratase
MFKEIKLKGGVLDLQVEIDSIRALRREFGTNVPFRIDPNCAWSIDTSVHVGEALKEELSGGGYLEDSCAGLDGMSAERKRLADRGIRTPLASNVAATSFPDVPRARDLDDMATFGGYVNVQEVARQSVKGFRRYTLCAV